MMTQRQRVRRIHPSPIFEISHSPLGGVAFRPIKASCCWRHLRTGGHREFATGMNQGHMMGIVNEFRYGRGNADIMGWPCPPIS